MYDIIFIGESNVSTDADFLQLKEKSPFAKRAKTLEQAQEKSTTKMFWAVWPGVMVDSEFNFDYRPTEHEQEYVHIWPNSVDKNLPSLGLFPKNKKYSAREIEYRFFVGMVKMNTVATHTKGYDIAFISYNENNANRRLSELTLHPGAKHNKIVHVSGVKGIHNAHMEAARKASTNMFWVVDADSTVLPTFNFNKKLSENEEKMVHIWHSRNPVNNLEYGFGGLKLLPRSAVLNMDLTSIDMTTSITQDIKIIPEVANITNFNTDPFSSWRSAFRECVKLSSKVIAGQNDTETEERLNTWMYGGASNDFAEYVRGGSSAGKWFGTTYKDDPEMLSKINNYEWLRVEFEEHVKTFPPETFK